MKIFETARIGDVELANRLLRSATFEGMCDAEGRPTRRYIGHYRNLSAKGLGALITGFTFTEPGGRSMQPGQAGIDRDSKIAPFAEAARAVHENRGRIFLQLAHAGRQTTPAAAGGEVVGPSSKKSWYFGSQPRSLTTGEVRKAATQFADAAWRAREAGFDGVQLHAAHGYLIHQFLHPAINDRRDEYALDPNSGIGTAFLAETIQQIRDRCTPGFPLLVKISSGDAWRPPLQTRHFVELIRFLDRMGVGAIEISYGTMDEALNIFRGAVPVDAVLECNPRFAAHHALRRLMLKTLVLPLVSRRFRPFAPMYNLEAACLAKQHTGIPVISVGGFRSGRHIRTAIESRGIDFVSLCRPLICEPNFALKLRQNPDHESPCANCNRCAVMCDSGRPTQCYGMTPGVPRACSQNFPAAPSTSPSQPKEFSYANRR